MTFEEVAAVFKSDEMLTRSRDARWLYDRAQEAGPSGLCVEVGAWCGWTACVMGAAGPAVLCVDTFMASDPWVKLDGAAGRLGIGDADRKRLGTLDLFARNVAAAGLGHRVAAVVSWSHLAALAVGDGTADLVFLDGDHSAPSVAADVISWVAKVKPDGLLCGDNWDIGEVRESVLAVLGRRKEWPEPQTYGEQIWWSRRARA